MEELQYSHIAGGHQLENGLLPQLNICILYDIVNLLLQYTKQKLIHMLMKDTRMFIAAQKSDQQKKYA